MNKHISKYLITGGGGYSGYNLALRIVEYGFEVVIFDIHPPPELLPLMIFTKGDISIYEDVFNSMKGVNCVFHMASYGMSGREQLDKKRIYEVNVKGTKNLIRACLENGVESIIYTSTYNVVFGGKEIINGCETLPYYPLNEHPDDYSKTKSMAEQLILVSNGCSFVAKLPDAERYVGSRMLRTCALRLAGVYGPGEQRHLPRIVKYLEMGLFKVVYGSINSKVDFLHVDNLVDAHWEASVALTMEKKYIAAGQSYFISDNKPINNFEFFRPLVEELGYKFPTIRIPISLVYYLAFITEIIHRFVCHIYNFQPILTRTEVYKTGITHFFKVDKAFNHFGYSPTKQNDLSAAILWFKNKRKQEKAFKKQQSNIFGVIRHLILTTLILFLIMSLLPIVG